MKGAILLGALLMAGCSTAWINAARDSIDALNAATTIAWEDYAKHAGNECMPVARACGKTDDSLDACKEYEQCMKTLKTIAQGVVSLHELVEQARRVFDLLEDDPDSTTNAARARQLWRLILKHASAVADALAQKGVPLEVRE